LSWQSRHLILTGSNYGARLWLCGRDTTLDAVYCDFLGFYKMRKASK
jgi:hypothetical protein